jgi:hypothetical protein
MAESHTDEFQNLETFRMALELLILRADNIATRRRKREFHGQHQLQNLCDERDHTHEVVEDVDRPRLLFPLVASTTTASTVIQAIVNTRRRTTRRTKSGAVGAAAVAI